MERFSTRYGLTADDPPISIRDDASAELRGVLVNIAYESGMSAKEVRYIVCQVFRRIEDANNWSHSNVDAETCSLLDACEWYEVYDLIEAIYRHLLTRQYEWARTFENEISAYMRCRGIGWALREGRVEARGEEAFASVLTQARSLLADGERRTAAREIHEALRDLSRRPIADLTGSIHHALAALECAARDVSGDARATLGMLVQKHRDLFPAPLDAAVQKLWGYASEQARHVREGRDPDGADAELTVHVAAALTVYLVRKVGQ